MKKEYISKGYTLNNPREKSKLGGKAYNLSILNALGINIPKGFVITSDLFQTVLNNFLKAEVDYLKIQNHLSRYEFPNDIKSRISEEINKLNTNKFSVRSSSATEDGRNASHAGLYKTLLNTQYEELEEAIKECWLSSFTPNVLAYLNSNKINLNANSMAVIVQEMINSDFSGVLFSKHPLKQDNKEIYIEVVEGLGDKLVSGESEPSAYVLTKTDYSISSISTNFEFNPRHLKELAEISTSLENYFGYPIDIEWAVQEGLLYILQCRPITKIL